GRTDPSCGSPTTDVAGWHDARDIPNYWAYAQNFVLHDRMFEPNASWSLPQHLFMVSEWSARCDQPARAASCHNALDDPAPPPDFDTVRQDGELGNIQSVGNFYADAADGTLPAVSWVVPSGDVSEHPPARISAGQAYVTSLVNAVMNGPDWSSTAIFLAWDDW